MIIDNQLLDQVSGQAKESERLRMNFNLHEYIGIGIQQKPIFYCVGTLM